MIVSINRIFIKTLSEINRYHYFYFRSYKHLLYHLSLAYLLFLLLLFFSYILYLLLLFCSFMFMFILSFSLSLSFLIYFYQFNKCVSSSTSNACLSKPTLFAGLAVFCAATQSSARLFYCNNTATKCTA